MDNTHVKLLQEKREELKDQIGYALGNVVQYLATHKIISVSMKLRILSDGSQTEQGDRLLDLLPSRGSNAFETLYDAICSFKLWGAADILKPDKRPHGEQPILPFSVSNDCSPDNLPPVYTPLGRSALVQDAPQRLLRPLRKPLNLRVWSKIRSQHQGMDLLGSKRNAEESRELLEVEGDSPYEFMDASQNQTKLFESDMIRSQHQGMDLLGSERNAEESRELLEVEGDSPYEFMDASQNQTKLFESDMDWRWSKRDLGESGEPRKVKEYRYQYSNPPRYSAKLFENVMASDAFKDAEPPLFPSKSYNSKRADKQSIKKHPRQSDKWTQTVNLIQKTENIAADLKRVTSDQADKCTQTATSNQTWQNNTVYETLWQVSDTFTEHGGILQSQKSDVILHVVPGAVSSKDYIDIHGAVFTDIEKALEKFEIHEEETLITPLVEYHTSGSYHFSRHLKINLPHFLPRNIDPMFVKFYVFSVDKYRQVSLQTLDASQGSNQDCFWKFENKNIQIFTTHFSGYFCTVCKSKLKEVRVSILFAKLFGSHVMVRSNVREIRLILYIWDERLNIKDFLQEKCRIVCDNNFKPLDEKSIQLPENTTSKSQIITKMFMEEMGSQTGWNHVLKPSTNRPMFPSTQVKDLLPAIDCCVPTDPLRFEWVLENSSDVETRSVPRLCIDAVCTSEPTTNFEKALQDADVNSLITLYLQNMKLNEASSETKNISDDNNRLENSDKDICHPKTIFPDRKTASEPLSSPNTQFNLSNTSCMEQIDQERTRTDNIFEKPSLSEENQSSSDNLGNHNPLERVTEKKSSNEETFKKEPIGSPQQGFPEIEGQKLNSKNGPAALPVQPTDRMLTSIEQQQNNLSGQQYDKAQTIPKTLFMDNFGE